MKLNKISIPSVRLINHDKDYILEFKGLINGVEKLSILRSGNQGLGFTFQDSDLFWSAHSMYDYAHAVARRVMLHNCYAGMGPLWKRAYIEKGLTARLCRALLPMMVHIDPYICKISSQISKHIRFYDWRMRCYGRAIGQALLVSENSTHTLRECLILSEFVYINDGIATWRVDDCWYEESPVAALECKIGDHIEYVRNFINKSTRQFFPGDWHLWTECSAKIFNQHPVSVREANILTLGFCRSLFACEKCIGDNQSAYINCLGARLDSAKWRGLRWFGEDATQSSVHSTPGRFVCTCTNMDKKRQDDAKWL